MVRNAWLVALMLLLAACGGTTEEKTDDGLMPGDLIITEVMVAATSDTYDDWFEIRNVSGEMVCVAGLRILAAKYDSKAFNVPATVTDCIAPGDFYVFGAKEHPYVQFLSSNIDLPATEATVTVYQGAVAIDSARYSKDDSTAALGAPPKGKSMSLCGYCQDAICAKSQNNWIVESTEMYDAENYGTPGAATVCGELPDGDVVDPGEIVPLNCTPAEPGDLIITEVMANPFNEDTQEWFEVYVTASAAGKDLNGVEVFAGGTSRGEIWGNACIPLVPDTYMVIGRSQFPFGEGIFTADADLPILKIPNKEALIEVRIADQLIDAATYDEKTDGVSFQLSAKHLDATANDDTLNWCYTPQTEEFAIAQTDGNTAYATPGAANYTCPIKCLPNECVAGDTCLPLSPLGAGDLQITEVMANPHDEETGEWFEVRVKPSAIGKHWNGLELWVDGTAKGTVEPADAICMTVAAEGYAVLAKNKATLEAQGVIVTVEIPKMTLKNDDVAMALKVGEVTVASEEYQEKSDGVSWQLNAKADIDPVNYSDWCFVPTEEAWIYAQAEGKNSYGTPGGPNAPCPIICEAKQCLYNDQCIPVVPMGVGDLVITEVMADPGTGKGEWFEAYVSQSAQGKHLNDLEVFVDGASKGSVQLPAGACVPAMPGDYLLFGKEQKIFATPYPVMADYTVSALTLKNETVSLEIKSGILLVDGITYKEDVAGVSYQLNQGILDPTSNNAEVNWCYTPVDASTLVEEGSYATPGAANVACQ
jgi:hypothetical protein